jgi:hypothetical protein
MTDDDPVFTAIERHRKAMQALAAAHEPPDALIDQLSSTEQDAFLAWLTTPPTTMASVIATLTYASRRACEAAAYANLAESAQYSPGDGEDDPSDILTAGEAFPPMIPTAVRELCAAIGEPVTLRPRTMRYIACNARTLAGRYTLFTSPPENPSD